MGLERAIPHVGQYARTPTEWCLVQDDKPVERGSDVSHVVVQVESIGETIGVLAGHGIEPDAPAHEHDGGMTTALIADPDGRRIELVQWPAGHAAGLSAADWPVTEDRS